jgi:hypothetical protein
MEQEIRFDFVKTLEFRGEGSVDPPRYSTELFYTMGSNKTVCIRYLNCNNMCINYMFKNVNPSHSNLHHATGSKCNRVPHDVYTRLKALDILIFQKLIVFSTSWLYKCCSIYLLP